MDDDFSQIMLTAFLVSAGFFFVLGVAVGTFLF